MDAGGGWTDRRAAPAPLCIACPGEFAGNGWADLIGFNYNK